MKKEAAHKRPESGEERPIRAHDLPRPIFMLRHERRIGQKPTAMAKAMLRTEYLWRRSSRLGPSQRSILASVAQDYPARPIAGSTVASESLQPGLDVLSFGRVGVRTGRRIPKYRNYI